MSFPPADALYAMQATVLANIPEQQASGADKASMHEECCAEVHCAMQALCWSTLAMLSSKHAVQTQLQCMKVAVHPLLMSSVQCRWLCWPTVLSSKHSGADTASLHEGCCAFHHKKKKKKDYALWRQFTEKPSFTPGCPGAVHHLLMSSVQCRWLCWSTFQSSKQHGSNA